MQDCTAPIMTMYRDFTKKHIKYQINSLSSSEGSAMKRMCLFHSFSHSRFEMVQDGLIRIKYKAIETSVNNI